MATPLTQKQIVALCHARRQGQFYPEPNIAGWSRCGGAIRRMIERMVERGLLVGPAPFKITPKGRKAIDGYDDQGHQLPIEP